MNLYLNTIVLIFEILYYSMFMKFARKDGKFYRYLLLFALFSFVSFFMNQNSIISYALILLMILYGLKYIVRLKISLYDLFFIFVMMLSKLLIEIVFGFSIDYFINNIEISKIILGVIKFIMVLCLSKHLESWYNKLHKCWDDNNFYIRYTFDILMFLYIIASCVFLIEFR